METYSMCYSYSVSDLMPRSMEKKETVTDIATSDAPGVTHIDKTSHFLRANLSRSSVNNILKKIQKNGKEKNKQKENSQKENIQEYKTIPCRNETNKGSALSLRVPSINPLELSFMRNGPSYSLGRGTQMTGMLWNLTKVTVRAITENKVDGLDGILDKELANLCKITHPNILLLMGICPEDDQKDEQLQLVFEHVHLGSLYFWIYKQKKVPSLRNCATIIIQITDALIFLHSLGYIHSTITSHAVQLVSPSLAKLGQLEHIVKEVTDEGKEDHLSSHTKQLLTDTGWHCLYNWLGPELLMGGQVTKLTDIYSLTCVIYELCTGMLPWSELGHDRITAVAMSTGCALPLDRESMPLELFQLLDKGLQSCPSHRNIDLHEIRDVFSRIKKVIDKEEDIGKPKLTKQLPSKPCPVRSYSSSAIQYNNALRKFSNESSQRKSVHSSASDYSYVSNTAKRNFLRSQPISPLPSKGLGSRSKTSYFYEAFSLSQGLDFSGSSGDSRGGDSSDSSSSSLSPTSGYSSYDMLDSQDHFHHSSSNRIVSRGEDSISPQRLSTVHYQPDVNFDIHRRSTPTYPRGIKPASHSLENHRSNNNGVTDYTTSSNRASISVSSTPKHSVMSSISSSSRFIPSTNSPRYKGAKSQSNTPKKKSQLSDKQFQRKYSSTNCFIESFKEETNEPKTRLRTQSEEVSELSHRKTLCRSHPRLFSSSKLSTESGYNTASPTMGLTGNMQLSNKYKSSADIVSELLQRPLPAKYFERNSRKSENSKSIMNCESVNKNHVKSIAKKLSNEKPSMLKSVELVKNVQTNERKIGRAELNTVNSVNTTASENAIVGHESSAGTDTVDHVTNDSVLTEYGGCTSGVERTISEGQDSKRGSLDRKSFIINHQMPHNERNCCGFKCSRRSKTPSISSRPSVCGSSVCADTEDFYLDDDLQPGLELEQPNMQLVACCGDNCCCSRDVTMSNDRLFDGTDNESILSMDIPSSGPTSLSIEGDGGRGARLSTKYSSVLAWGVEQACISSSDGESLD